MTRHNPRTHTTLPKIPLRPAPRPLAYSGPNTYICQCGREVKARPSDMIAATAAWKSTTLHIQNSRPQKNSKAPQPPSCGCTGMTVQAWAGIHRAVLRESAPPNPLADDATNQTTAPEPIRPTTPTTPTNQTTDPKNDPTRYEYYENQKCGLLTINHPVNRPTNQPTDQLTGHPTPNQYQEHPDIDTKKPTKKNPRNETWVCTCTCGTQIAVKLDYILKQNAACKITPSCGCIQKTTVRR
jgi:hypothetical protein